MDKLRSGIVSPRLHSYSERICMKFILLPFVSFGGCISHRLQRVVCWNITSIMKYAWHLQLQPHLPPPPSYRHLSPRNPFKLHFQIFLRHKCGNYCPISPCFDGNTVHKISFWAQCFIDLCENFLLGCLRYEDGNRYLIGQLLWSVYSSTRIHRRMAFSCKHRI